MKKILVLILIMVCFACFRSYADIKTSYIKTNEYEGMIFSSQYKLPYINGDLDQAARWDPDEENISEAEKLSRPYIQAQGVCSGRELKDYKRQYFGFINKSSEKIIWINYFIYSPPFENWEKELVNVNDGGCSFFNLEVNLTAKNIFNFSVSGDG